MDKALIEKAAREFTKTISREQKESFGDFIVRQTDVYNAFIAGATWQREQLIKELREWITSNNRYIGLNGAGPVLLPEELLAKLDLLEKRGEK